MIKILHVLSDSNFGGAGKLLLNCLSHFDKTQFDIKVVLPRDSELSRNVLALGYEVIETKNGRDRSFDISAIKEFKRIFKDGNPDIVHTHSSLSARIAARGVGVPLIFQTHHCAVEPTKKESRFPIKQINGYINNKLSDVVIATASAAESILIKKGTDPRKIKLIVNGTEPQRKASAEEISSLRDELGLCEGDFVYSIIARLEEVKDHKTFIEAAAEASRVHPNLKFLIVGKGSLEEELRAYTYQQAAENNIIFCGFASDVAPYYALTNVNCNCSRSETTCLAISEGMSLSKPSIVSDCDGNTAMIQNGVNGLVFERGNSESLSTAMITLYENKDLYERLSANAYLTFGEKYTAEVMTRTLEKLYVEAIQNKKR